MESIKLSILSKIPPCPGSIFPVSFILSNLLKYDTMRSPIWADKDNIIAKIKYLNLRKKLKSIWNKILHINPNNKSEKIEKINDPITPDRVFFGLILVNLFHLKIFPKIYPPMSEEIVNIITQNNNINDDAVSFLKCKIESKDTTNIVSKKIIEVFLLKTEKASKLAKIKIAYKKETM